ncbi:uncharacterized protein LOC114842053 isoform X1 [Betta splendens]|uniref:Uncharacterized protein LOC114842053 isoform X1 n=1 Tax=Betta splendens TaxID=158456 RepID=A0A6P7KL81_BETSP|nr:uncharacterized protein LOC114842053 isoform X1 [Betta splendens]
MASQCKRQQCTIDRRGFRQELDSWRHKLINCVGFESILEGLFGPELVKDLKIFKDFGPITVSDWSFDENCLFCCLRRDKVKEHLINLNNKGLEDKTKHPLVKDQSTISRLEKQAEEFLSAVLSRKDVPNFTDPHIPLVARDILQRMIRQFAAEYTSKTSSPQDSCSDTQPCSDQSWTAPLVLTGAPTSSSPAATLSGPAQNQNPVLSKLLMADQDTPLDLTIKKAPAESCEQDGVLDLSIKKSRCSSSSSSSSSSSQPVHSHSISPATSTLKGESPGLRVAKAKDLQSTSTLEQFMAKLCPHHQRQIVDAIGFLQTEVKALASSNTHQTANSTTGIHETSCSTAKSLAVTPEKSNPELKPLSESTPKKELHNMSLSSPSSSALNPVPENAMSLKTSVTAACGLDLRSPRSGSNLALVPPTENPVDTENNRHSDHAPLKMKIMASNVADRKKLSCVLNASLTKQSYPLDNRHGNLNLSNRTETHSARLSSTVKKHHQASHTYQARQRETLEHSKEKTAFHVTPNSPRTARKTIRSSTDRTRDSVCRGMTDPDLGHCDIVFIDKPITECFKEQHRSMVPRRNARKSTRGHMYSDEIWELKTVRTLAGRGNCPNPMPELTTLVTPKQILSKPEGVPPVDMPFVGSCRETMHQQMPTEQSDESIIPGTGDMVEVADSEVDVIVETSQTDQCQNKSQSSPASMRSLEENNETNINTLELDTGADLERTTQSEESVAHVSYEAGLQDKPEPQVDSDRTGQIVIETNLNPLERTILQDAEPHLSSENVHKTQPILQQDSIPSSPSAVNQVVEETGENRKEELQDKQSQEPEPEPQIHSDSFEVKENSHFDVKENLHDATDESLEKEPELTSSESVYSFVSLETEEKRDFDVSSKTLDALLKELPPWRRKKGTPISMPKRLRQTEPVIVGYVNGRPISASDRSLRRRSGNSNTSPNESLLNASHDDSTIENKNVEKSLSETDLSIKSLDTNTVTDQVMEQSSDTPSSPVPPVPRSKQIPKQKRVQRDQDTLSVQTDQSPDQRQATESTRQLRSASQKSTINPLSSPSLNDLPSILPPKPTAANTCLPTEEPLPVPLPSNIPNMSPPVINATPTAVSEQSQQHLETTVKLSIENSEPVEYIKIDETQKTEVESRTQTKQKLRSAKAVDNSKNENQEPLGGVSNALENQSPVKTEMQAQTSLRSKRILRKDTEASEVASLEKPNVASLEDKTTTEHDNSSSVPDRHTRMPLRNETSKSEMLNQPVTQPTPAFNKKLALRSQSSIAPVSSGISGRQSDSVPPTRALSEKIAKAQGKSSTVSVAPVLAQSLPITPKPEPPKQTNKFLETLTGDESQQLITNLNIKYDKMQKGWVQMDKEGQPGPKYKSKADRQAAIWKSKRRARKPKSSEHQKYSPVQMLFMKSFNLSSICRWFLESTETKSLVIVKKVNTRLPSETQLCFHSSSSTSGSSQGVFPSLQAERLKKHLKKFAIASPVKSNPKSQKLIAKALEQDANAVKGKERRELSSTTRTLSKSCSSAQAGILIGEAQKSSGKSKNPASARILRKYSNIREKMQVQQTNARLKKVSKTLKSGNMKRLAATKSTARSSLKTQKSPLRVSKQIKTSTTKMERRKALGGKKKTKHPVQERGVRTQSSSRCSRDGSKKEVPKRCSQRLGLPKTMELNPTDTLKSKADVKKLAESQKADMERPAVNKMNAAKVQTKESPLSPLSETTENSAETPQQSTDGKVPASPDQVLTRSQRKMEAAVPSCGSPSQASKRAKSVTTQNASPKTARKAEEHTLTRSGALKSPVKRSQAALLPRNATRRAQELLETPSKRKRTSLSK